MITSHTLLSIHCEGKGGRDIQYSWRDITSTVKAYQDYIRGGEGGAGGEKHSIQ